jgi:hypothetical protein
VNAVRALVGLIFVGCSLSAAQQSQVTDFEGCADQRYVAYREFRARVIAVMLQQHLDLADTLTGLEVLDEVYSGRDVRLASADADFMNRNHFFDYYGTGSMGRPWFEELRTCLEERHGYKIRRIEPLK